MQHIEEFVSGWQCLHAARQKLHEPTFENIVFRFVEVAHTLPKNAKMDNYRTTLQHFFVQYYNEFMFKCQTRSEECVAFIDTLNEFSSIASRQKKDYQQLFKTLSSYYRGSVGGTKKGIPLLCLPEKCLRDSPSYYLDWHYDDVQNILLSMSLNPAKCAFCQKRPRSEDRFVGGRFCPAGCLPVCGRCETKTEVVSDFLQRTTALMIPESSMAMREYLSTVFQVCSVIATDPVAALRDLQLSVDEHGKALVVKNKALLSDNHALRQKLLQKTSQVALMVNDNEKLQSLLCSSNEDYRVMGQQFRHCEDALYDERERSHRSLSEVQQQLDSSICEQWRYYECLKQHGLTS